MVPPPKKKRKSNPSIEEIKFDTNARENYLTGFHKRKLQRTKHAREEAVKREREAKLEARRIVRCLSKFCWRRKVVNGACCSYARSERII